MAAANLTPAQLGSPELAHYGERLNFVAASAASSPSKPKREQAAEESHIRLDTGGCQAPRLTEVFASRVEVTSRWRSRALSQSWVP